MSGYEMMKRFNQEPIDEQGSDSERDRYEEAIEKSPINLVEILAIKELVTNSLRARARTRIRNPESRSEGFAMADIENVAMSVDDLYDGSSDRYLSARVQQVDDDQWRMSVNFRTTLNKREAKLRSAWERYKFDWLDDGNVSAWKVTELHNYTLGEKVIDVIEARPLLPEDCVQLRERMHEIADLTNPPEPGSFFSDWQERP